MDNQREFTQESSPFLKYDPVVIVQDILKCWKIILAAVFMIAAISYVMLDRSYEPLYRSEATLVVTTQDSTTTVFSNLKSTSELATVFTNLLNSSVLQNRILEKLGMTSWDCTIHASAVAETNLLNLSVVAKDPRSAFRIIWALIEDHETVTFEVVGDMVIEVLRYPQIPTAPMNGSDVIREVRMTAMMALVASCACVGLVSFRRDTIRSSSEAEQKLPCWCLGEIHHERKYRTFREWRKKMENTQVITNPSCSAHFVETFRKLRRRVEQHMPTGKVLMVTSVSACEGKSTVSVNLALAQARKKKRVLLIDLDLRKPMCQKLLGYRESGFGTRDVIMGRTDLGSAVIHEPMSGLDFLPGRPIGNATTSIYEKVISSEGVARMLKEAQEHYDSVIVDLPPISVAGDVEYVMEYADASLLVIRQNLVTADALRRAITTLNKGRAVLLGCVLNDVYTSRLTGQYGGYGDYSYGYGKDKYGRHGYYSRTGEKG